MKIQSVEQWETLRNHWHYSQQGENLKYEGSSLFRVIRNIAEAVVSKCRRHHCPQESNVQCPIIRLRVASEATSETQNLPNSPRGLTRAPNGLEDMLDYVANRQAKRRFLCSSVNQQPTGLERNPFPSTTMNIVCMYTYSNTTSTYLYRCVHAWRAPRAAS
jgi:hypothetical protein